MNLKQTRLHILHQAADLSKEAKTGVSLHCHTRYSKEMLDFVPHYAEQIPIIAHFWRKERDRYLKNKGKAVDFSTAYWSPPMPEQEVFNIEKKQINDCGLEALVSITDHDCIDANLKICDQPENARSPISMEWTVPFEYGFFHLGVHNLPKASAVEISKQLLDYTFNEEKKNDAELREIFAMLDSLPEVLVVLNHPLWDIEMVGKEKHKVLLDSFISEYGKWIHAFEINGFRKWSENKAVIEMAESLGIPLVTGGDRHGCKPNTVINLTNSKTFAEFAEEIRVDKRSEVVIMPEYRQPLQSRQLQSFSEILKLYPEFPADRRHWFNRVHYDTGGGLRPLSDYRWKHFGGPIWLQLAIKTLGVLGNPAMRPIFRLAMKRKDRVPKQSAVNSRQLSVNESRHISESKERLLTDNR